MIPADPNVICNPSTCDPEDMDDTSCTGPQQLPTAQNSKKKESSVTDSHVCTSCDPLSEVLSCDPSSDVAVFQCGNAQDCNALSGAPSSMSSMDPVPVNQQSEEPGHSAHCMKEYAVENSWVGCVRDVGNDDVYGSTCSTLGEENSDVYPGKSLLDTSKIYEDSEQIKDFWSSTSTCSDASTLSPSRQHIHGGSGTCGQHTEGDDETWCSHGNTGLDDLWNMSSVQKWIETCTEYNQGIDLGNRDQNQALPADLTTSDTSGTDSETLLGCDMTKSLTGDEARVGREEMEAPGTLHAERGNCLNAQTLYVSCVLPEHLWNNQQVQLQVPMVNVQIAGQHLTSEEDSLRSQSEPTTSCTSGKSLPVCSESVTLQTSLIKTTSLAESPCTDSLVSWKFSDSEDQSSRRNEPSLFTTIEDTEGTLTFSSASNDPWTGPGNQESGEHQNNNHGNDDSFWGIEDPGIWIGEGTYNENQTEAQINVCGRNENQAEAQSTEVAGEVLLADKPDTGWVSFIETEGFTEIYIPDNGPTVAQDDGKDLHCGCLRRSVVNNDSVFKTEHAKCDLKELGATNTPDWPFGIVPKECDVPSAIPEELPVEETVPHVPDDLVQTDKVPDEVLHHVKAPDMTVYPEGIRDNLKLFDDDLSQEVSPHKLFPDTQDMLSEHVLQQDVMLDDTVHQQEISCAKFQDEVDPEEAVSDTVVEQEVVPGDVVYQDIVSNDVQVLQDEVVQQELTPAEMVISGDSWTPYHDPDCSSGFQHVIYQNVEDLSCSQPELGIYS